MMSISQFINPVDEIVGNGDDQILKQIIKVYLEGNKRDHETDEEEIDIISIRVSKDLTTLSTLRLYEEQQENGDREIIQRLNRVEQVMKSREAGGKQQRTITSHLFLI